MKAKIVKPAELPALIRRLKNNNKKLVFTNGTFDILHAGHVRYLQQARRAGHCLIVGVNSDASVRSYKGLGRPINKERDRLEVLTALECVDFAVLFSEPTPLKLILKIRPEVLAKGADWKMNQIAGANEVKSWGGKVKLLKVVKGRSTTNIIGKVLRVYGSEKLIEK